MKIVDVGPTRRLVAVNVHDDVAYQMLCNAAGVEEATDELDDCPTALQQPGTQVRRRVRRNDACDLFPVPGIHRAREQNQRPLDIALIAGRVDVSHNFSLAGFGLALVCPTTSGAEWRLPVAGSMGRRDLGGELVSPVMRTAMAARSTAILAAVGAAAAACALGAPTAGAEMTYGNYELRIMDRYDFHTWAWAVSGCGHADCQTISAIPMPVAKAFEYRGEAHLVDGRYTMTVDVPDGLRCGNVYYGPIVPTRDTYSWDAQTMQGTLASSFTAGCDGAPGGTFVYPFTLVRM